MRIRNEIVGFERCLEEFSKRRSKVDDEANFRRDK